MGCNISLSNDWPMQTPFVDWLRAQGHNVNRGYTQDIIINGTVDQSGDLLDNLWNNYIRQCGDRI